MDISNAVIAVTGGSSGIGKECARRLVQQGARVYDLSRRCITGEKTDGVTGVRCDVTGEQSVREAFEFVMADAGRLDGLVCCAGSGLAGAVEETSDTEAEALMQVNYFGAVRCAREAMRIMRPARRGTIVFISSVAALFGIPFQAFYSAGKYALEGTAEALRNEARPFGVRVVCVLPGDTRTGFTAARRYTAQTGENTPYMAGFCSALNSMVKDELHGAPVDLAAKCVLRALKAKNPPPRIIVGAKYRMAAFVKRLLPDRAVSAALYALYCRGEQKSELWSFEKDVLKRKDT